MNHLGHRLSALVDDELSGDEQDRVHAHLAGCAQCRAGAAELRELKRRLRELPDVPADAVLTRRLLAMAEPGGPVPRRPRALRGRGQPRPAFRAFRESRRPDGPAPRPWRAGFPGRHRTRYVIAGVVSCLVAGLSAMAFTVGGTPAAPGPQITPPVRMYSVEHAITTGEVPFAGPSADQAPSVPAPSRQP
jgi:anti-sigma factor RsiW